MDVVVFSAAAAAAYVDYDVVAILVNRQWQGNMVIFIKRNGGTISSMATQTLMSPGQYQDYVVQNDNMQAALAWDNINSKIYAFYLYWGDPGPHNSGMVIAKFDVNLNEPRSVKLFFKTLKINKSYSSTVHTFSLRLILPSVALLYIGLIICS